MGKRGSNAGRIRRDVDNGNDDWNGHHHGLATVSRAVGSKIKIGKVLRIWWEFSRRLRCGYSISDKTGRDVEGRRTIYTAIKVNNGASACKNQAQNLEEAFFLKGGVDIHFTRLVKVNNSASACKNQAQSLEKAFFLGGGWGVDVQCSRPSR